MDFWKVTPRCKFQQRKLFLAFFMKTNHTEGWLSLPKWRFYVQTWTPLNRISLPSNWAFNCDRFRCESFVQSFVLELKRSNLLILILDLHFVDNVKRMVSLPKFLFAGCSWVPSAVVAPLPRTDICMSWQVATTFILVFWKGSGKTCQPFFLLAGLSCEDARSTSLTHHSSHDVQSIFHPSRIIFLFASEVLQLMTCDKCLLAQLWRVSGLIVCPADVGSFHLPQR